MFCDTNCVQGAVYFLLCEWPCCGVHRRRNGRSHSCENNILFCPFSIYKETGFRYRLSQCIDLKQRTDNFYWLQGVTYHVSVLELSITANQIVSIAIEFCFMQNELN